jgi:prepilin peptidase dependent protein D
MKLIKKLKKAYTLVELVVTIAVIAILAAVAVGAYFGITNSATISRLEQEARQAYTNVQLVGSEGDKNHKLNTNGIYIDDLDYFEERYNSMSGDSFYITEGNVDPTVVYGYTLYFFNKTESNISYYHKVDTNYNYFAYYNPSILTKRALVDIITGKIYKNQLFYKGAGLKARFMKKKKA